MALRPSVARGTRGVVSQQRNYRAANIRCFSRVVSPNNEFHHMKALHGTDSSDRLHLTRF
ncbi:hypothetical protein T09_9864 [Trichinella sp. T9]|nr:hypothetical protein T09_9864 [Trichinella sp. T9]